MQCPLQQRGTNFRADATLPTVLASPRALGLNLLVVACSSGSGSAGVGAGDCGSTCDRIASANCPSFERAACLTQCEVVRAYGCTDAYDSMNACLLSLPILCRPDGTPGLDMAAVTSACMNPYSDWAKCMACVVHSSDGACAACGKTSCCAENGAMYDDPSMPDYLKCRDACNTSSCESECLQAHPSLVGHVEAAVVCGQQKCASACQ